MEFSRLSGLLILLVGLLLLLVGVKNCSIGAKFTTRPIEVENWRDYWVETLTIQGESWVFKKDFFDQGTKVRIRIAASGYDPDPIRFYILNETNYGKFVSKTSFVPELERYGTVLDTLFEIKKDGTFYFVLDRFGSYTEDYKVDIKLDGTRYGTHTEYIEVAEYAPIYSLGLLMLTASFPMLLMGSAISAKPSMEINPWYLLFSLCVYGAALVALDLFTPISILGITFRSVFLQPMLYSDVTLFSLSAVIVFQSLIMFRKNRPTISRVPLPLPKPKPKASSKKRTTRKKRRPSGKTRFYSKRGRGSSVPSFRLPSGETRCGNCGVINRPKAKHCRNCNNPL